MDLFEYMPKQWREVLTLKTIKEVGADLNTFLTAEYKKQKVYPEPGLIWNAMNFFSPKETKVVIVGQDPYHQLGQAQGLSFSVPKEFKIPPSLRNIYKELEQEFNVTMYPNGDLTHWANQGVLLLNRVLTVRDSEPNSHKNIGWEAVTKEIIVNLSASNTNMVFLLWGGAAHQLEKVINQEKHLILKANHPSPLSANRGGWFGNEHFIKTNEYLKNHNRNEINWKNSPAAGDSFQLSF